MGYYNITPSSPSLKHKLKQSLCFSGCSRRRLRPPPPPQHQCTSDNIPTLIWVRIKGLHDHSLSEIKEKCRSKLAFSSTKHKRYSTAEFSYDALSYSLNFEDEFNYDDEPPLKNFSARLPPLKNFSARLPPSPPVTVAIN